MATSISILRSPLSALTVDYHRDLSNSTNLLLKSSFVHNNICAPSRKDATVRGRCFRSPVSAAASDKSLDNIPKQFREGNRKDGLMDNFKNVPQYLYGLSPSQMDMFMTEDNHVRRQAESVTKEMISPSHNYLNHGGM